MYALTATAVPADSPPRAVCKLGVSDAFHLAALAATAGKGQGRQGYGVYAQGSSNGYGKGKGGPGGKGSNRKGGFCQSYMGKGNGSGGGGCCGAADHHRRECPDNHKVCDNCSKEGHLARVCWGEAKCKVCGVAGHSARFCTQRHKACEICHKTGHLKATCRYAASYQKTKDSLREDAGGKKRSRKKEPNEVRAKMEELRKTEADYRNAETRVYDCDQFQTKLQQDKANEEAEQKRKYEEAMQKMQARYKKRSEENKERGRD